MAILDRAALKLFFETGDKPTQAQFADFIDSVPNFDDDGIGVWTKFTFDFTDFQPNAGTAGLVTIISLPALSILDNVQIKHSTPWAGGPIINSVMVLADPGGLFQYSTILDVFSFPAPTFGVSGRTVVNAIFDASGAFNLSLGLTVFGGVIDDLSQGDVNVWLKIDQLP